MWNFLVKFLPYFYCLGALTFTDNFRKYQIGWPRTYKIQNLLPSADSKKNLKGLIYMDFHLSRSISGWQKPIVYSYFRLSSCSRPKVAAKRGTSYCWAWRKQSFETSKLTMFLETKAPLSYCNWSIKMARIIWFGSTNVDKSPAYVKNWQRFK